MATANNNMNNRQESEGQEKQELFEYKNSGIRERKGKIPLWIWFVTVVLLIWGVYYLVAFWK